MKLSYPASHQVSKLNDSLLSLKIARHSPCSTCDSCSGLRPPPGWDVVLDELPSESSLGDLEQYGSDDDDGPPAYLEFCACGHHMKEHGADESEIGGAEFARRGLVAVRLDELLKVRPVLPPSKSSSFSEAFAFCRCGVSNFIYGPHSKQHFQDVGKMLDFDYTDEDIISLRLQMRLPVLISPSLNAMTSPGKTS